VIGSEFCPIFEEKWIFTPLRQTSGRSLSPPLAGAIKNAVLLKHWLLFPAQLWQKEGA
jgi:hypothetical protein